MRYMAHLFHRRLATTLRAPTAPRQAVSAQAAQQSSRRTALIAPGPPHQAPRRVLPGSPGCRQGAGSVGRSALVDLPSGSASTLCAALRRQPVTGLRSDVEPACLGRRAISAVLTRIGAHRGPIAPASSARARLTCDRTPRLALPVGRVHCARCRRPAIAPVVPPVGARAELRQAAARLGLQPALPGIRALYIVPGS